MRTAAVNNSQRAFRVEIITSPLLACAYERINLEYLREDIVSGWNGTGNEPRDLASAKTIAYGGLRDSSFSEWLSFSIFIKIEQIRLFGTLISFGPRIFLTETVSGAVPCEIAP
jgi:hypothetical protein